MEVLRGQVSHLFSYLQHNHFTLDNVIVLRTRMTITYSNNVAGACFVIYAYDYIRGGIKSSRTNAITF